MRLLAVIKESAGIARYLAGLGEATELPRRKLIRAEPRWQQGKARALRRQVAQNDAAGGRDPCLRSDFAHDPARVPELPGGGEGLVGNTELDFDVRFGDDKPRQQAGQVHRRKRDRDGDAEGAARLGAEVPRFVLRALELVEQRRDTYQSSARLPP